MKVLRRNAAIALSFVSVLACASDADAPGGGEVVPPDPRATVGVSSSNICVPTGLFFIVRKDGRSAAVRFTEVRKLKESATGYATYESYGREDGHGRFLDSPRGTGTLSVLGWRGFHPFVEQKGDARLPAGPVTLAYNYPSCVSFTPYRRSAGDYGVEIAPTHWTEIRDVVTSEPGLRWFRYDAAGARHLELHREEL